ncbi:MAG: hypothetical protein GX587_07520 [Bacteroidales bacterium]|nr:hypothetical protein [Bacteroidales bacterium]
MEVGKMVWQMTLSDVLMVILTLTYVITTICILISTNKQFHETLRPKVHVDFKFKNSEMFVLVKNYGERSARNISIKFTPDITYKMGEERSLNTTPLINKLSFLAPKNEIDTIIGMGFEILPKHETDDVIAEVSYEAEDGVKYLEKQTFSMAAYSKRVYTKTNDINDIVSELKSISNSIKNK